MRARLARYFPAASVVRRIPLAAALLWVAAALLAPVGWWIAVGLLVQAVAYLAGRASVRRADEAVITARVAEATRPLALQLAAMEREKAERDEAAHLAVVDPPPVRRSWADNGAGYRSATTTDYPAGRRDLNRKHPRTEVRGHPTARSTA